MLLMLLVSLATANSQSFSKVKLAYSNKCNVYAFKMEGTSDTTCFLQTIYITTINFDSTLVRTYSREFQFTFPDTGTYEWIANVRNICLPFEKRDTVIYGRIRVTCMPDECSWSKVKLAYNNKCNTYVFEVGSLDTCISYTTYIYNFKTQKWTDTFRTRIFNKRFADTGKYELYVIARNKCGGCDTAYSNFVTVTCNPTSCINEVIKDEPRLIRMYDMMGRPVKHIRKEEIMILLYDDGSTKKVIQQ